MNNKPAYSKEWIFSKGCLDKNKHGPLVEEIDQYANTAGLRGENRRYIWEPIQDLSEKEVFALQNIKKFSSKGQGGLLYVGYNPIKIVDKMMALTGCMLRNYVDARFMLLEPALEEYKEHRSLAAEVACIPNLHTEFTKLPLWRAGLLYDLLLQHKAEGKLIIGYVQDEKKMQASYPSTLCEMLKKNFFRIG